MKRLLTLYKIANYLSPALFLGMAWIGWLLHSCSVDTFFLTLGLPAAIVFLVFLPLVLVVLKERRCVTITTSIGLALRFLLYMWLLIIFCLWSTFFDIYVLVLAPYQFASTLLLVILLMAWIGKKYPNYFDKINWGPYERDNLMREIYIRHMACMTMLPLVLVIFLVFVTVAQPSPSTTEYFLNALLIAPVYSIGFPLLFSESIRTLVNGK